MPRNDAAAHAVPANDSVAGPQPERQAELEEGEVVPLLQVLSSCTMRKGSCKAPLALHDMPLITPYNRQATSAKLQAMPPQQQERLAEVARQLEEAAQRLLGGEVQPAVRLAVEAQLRLQDCAAAMKPAVWGAAGLEYLHVRSLQCKHNRKTTRNFPH